MNEMIFEKNIAALNQYYPDIAEAFSGFDEHNCIPSDMFAFIDNYFDKPVLSIRYKEKKYQLESAYDNDLFTDSIFQNIDSDWEMNGKMLFFGLGNGMYVRKFLKLFPKDHDIFVYEPFEDVFLTVIRNIDISDIISNKRFHLFIDYKDNKVSYDSVIKCYMDYTDIFTFKYSMHLNYGTVFKEKANSWINMIDDALNSINADHILYMRFGEKFIDNNYSNFKYLINSKKLSDLQNVVPENIPVIIVSAGPSLSKNIQELKNAAGRSIIVALDASVNPLIRAGIHPDIMIAIDPTKGEKYLTESGTESVPLVCDLNAAKSFLEVQNGLKFFTYGLNMHVNEFLSGQNIELPILEAGGSVANSAFSFAHYVGSKKIILVGQDLAFTDDKTHAEGSVRGGEGKEFINDKIKHKITEEDINGNPILSCAEYRAFRLWFENQIKYYPEIEVIDATEGGAKINGSRIMTLKEAIKENCNQEYDFRKELNKANDLFTSEQKTEFRKHIFGVIERIEKNETKIKKAKDLYSKMRSLAKSNKSNCEKMIKYGRKVNKIIDEIQEDSSMYYMRDIATKEIGEMLSTIYKTEENLDEEILAVCNIGCEYLSNLEKAIEIFKAIHNSYVKNNSF